jgi:hypothetical protein
MPLSTQQTNELNIASQRRLAGNASATDIRNLDYAARTYGYRYTPTPAAPAAPAPSQSGALATVFGSPSSLSTPDQLMAFINGGQVSSDTGVPVRRSLSDYAEAARTVLGGGATAPAAPSFSADYEALRGTYGIADLEKRSVDLQAQQDAIIAETKTLTDAERGSSISAGTATGRIGEINRVQQEKLDAVVRQQNEVTNQLKVKTDVVSNIMQFKQLDYTSAVQLYDTKFSQSIQAINLVSGLDDKQKSDVQKSQDDARANLQIIYNQLSSGGLSQSQITPQQRQQISSLETKAGLPMGFFSYIQDKNPKSDIVSTTTRTGPDGYSYADVVVRDPATGALSVQSARLGQVKSAAGTDETASFYKDAQATLTDLTSGKMDWGQAFNFLKAKYNAPDDVIDTLLNKTVWSQAGAYETQQANRRSPATAPIPGYHVDQRTGALIRN